MGSIITLSIVQSALELGFIYALVALALFISFSILNIADQAGFVGGAALDHIGHIDAVGIDAQLLGRLCIGDTCRSSDIWIICSDGSWCLLRFCDRFLTDKNGDSVHFGGNHRKYRIVYN